MKQATASIKQIAVIRNATPEQVYNALTDPKIHSKFTGSKATGAPKVGGKMTAWDGYISGKYTKLVKGKLIAQEWSTTEFPEDFPPLMLKISLKKRGKDTVLSMAQTGVPKSQAKEYSDGWKEWYWEKLNEYFNS